MSQPGETLHGMATTLLGMVVNQLIADGNPGPSRHIVYMSPIPADCAQVAVLMSGWLTYPGVDGPTSCLNARWIADLSVIITRCTPAMVKNPGMGKDVVPSPEKMAAAAKIASDDAESLLAVLGTVGEAGGISLNVQSPQGGLQTVELNLQIPVGAI